MIKQSNLELHPILFDRVSPPKPLTRLSLIRETYRTLINDGRSYAAFTEKERSIIKTLTAKGEILDPMSGYGLLTQFCSEFGLHSYCVELNLPQYFWQYLCQPSTSKTRIKVIELLLAWKEQWPSTTVRALVSDEYFIEEQLKILVQLLELNGKAIEVTCRQEENKDDFALALLLPFVGRLSCSVPGDNSTHTKKGGMCVFHGWEEDYETYLMAVIQRLDKINSASKSSNHLLFHGDARTFNFPRERFGAMVTSPPYPNHRDFISMFEVEHKFLALIGKEGNLALRDTPTHIIGSNFVANRGKRLPKNKSANRFLSTITSMKRSKTAVYDDEVYYLPYLEHYFADLEAAYYNVSLSLKQDFEGYITVVNNTHRNVIVPVSDVIIELWRDLGFKAEIFDATESFHVGTKNPRARGLRARHTQYVIKLWR